MTDRDILLANIEHFLAETKMGPTYFGQRACKDSHLVERLRNGGDINTKTAAKIWAFLNWWSNERKA